MNAMNIAQVCILYEAPIQNNVLGSIQNLFHCLEEHFSSYRGEMSDCNGLPDSQ
jgi:hypothetical protein